MSNDYLNGYLFGPLGVIGNYLSGKTSDSTSSSNNDEVTIGEGLKWIAIGAIGVTGLVLIMKAVK